jgi:hypothetical protein
MIGVEKELVLERARIRGRSRRKRGVVRTLPPAITIFGEYLESVSALEKFFEGFGNGKVSYVALLESDFFELEKACSKAYKRCFKFGLINNSPDFEEVHQRYSNLVSKIDYGETCRPEDAQGEIVVEGGEKKKNRKQYDYYKKKGPRDEDKIPCRVAPEVRVHIPSNKVVFGE